MCAALFIIGEALILFLSPIPYLSGLWSIRVVLGIFFLRAMESHRGVDADNADMVVISNLYDFCLGTIPMEELVSINNSLITLSAIAAHRFKWFLVGYLPYYLQTLIIFLPLFSAIFLLTTGYLIGYVLAGYFATFCMA